MDLADTRPHARAAWAAIASCALGGLAVATLSCKPAPTQPPSLAAEASDPEPVAPQPPETEAPEELAEGESAPAEPDPTPMLFAAKGFGAVDSDRLHDRLTAAAGKPEWANCPVFNDVPERGYLVVELGLDSVGNVRVMQRRESSLLPEEEDCIFSELGKWIQGGFALPKGAWKASRKNWKKPRYWALLEFRSPGLPSRLDEAERGEISAGLERKVAFGVVEPAIEEIRACYDEALAAGLPKGGVDHTDLQLLVTPLGSVSKVFIADSFDQDTRPTECVTQTLEGLAFPANDVSTDFNCRVPFKGPARCSAKTSL